jgi:NAD(P)-dependent dehydrogenase (short-subunit alcohol dehydrogenase family)
MDSADVEKLGLELDVFRGKIAVVTGGGRGIGREIAKAFAGLGAAVAVVDVSDEGVQTCQEIEERGGKALFVEADLAEEKDIEKAVQTVLAKFGAINILVNNAIVCPVESVEEMSTAAWDKTVAVNLRAPFLLTKMLLPKFAAQGSGTIINLLSSAGSLPPEVGQPFMSAYSASKGGLAAFTLSLAPEVEQKGIQVAGIWVGITDTAGAREAFKTLARHLEMPFEQFTQAMTAPSKTAAAIVYVAVHIDEYHGVNVECDKIMAKLGLLTETAALAAEVPVVLAYPPPEPQADIEILYRQNTENTQNLLAVIYELKAGFEQLPFFVRPMANRAFRLKTGASIKEWEAVVGGMVEHQKVWEQVVKNKDKAKVEELSSVFVGNFEEIADSLNKLLTYIVESPKEAARFTKDKQTLKVINETAARQALIVKVSLSTLKLTCDLLQNK